MCHNEHVFGPRDTAARVPRPIARRESLFCHTDDRAQSRTSEARGPSARARATVVIAVARRASGEVTSSRVTTTTISLLSSHNIHGTYVAIQSILLRWATHVDGPPARYNRQASIRPVGTTRSSSPSWRNSLPSRTAEAGLPWASRHEDMQLIVARGREHHTVFCKGCGRLPPSRV